MKMELSFTRIFWVVGTGALALGLILMIVGIILAIVLKKKYK